jgi:mono/diheme cytochrome c family protein
MKIKKQLLISALAVAAIVGASSVVAPLACAGEASSKKEAVGAPGAPSYSTDEMRVQGEQRYRANCGRCHAAPRKFPPRMMATVLRHMRVRATITDEDMKLVLFYMSQ